MRSRETDSTTRGSRTDAVLKGTKFVAQELIREPVKEAVHEALREEASVVKESDSGRGEDGSRSRLVSRSGERSRESSDSGSGGSKLRLLMMGLVAALGLAYYARKRSGGGGEQEAWSQPGSESQRGESSSGQSSGYGSEGEMGSTSTGSTGTSGTAGTSGTSSTTGSGDT